MINKIAILTLIMLAGCGGEPTTRSKNTSQSKTSDITPWYESHGDLLLDADKSGRIFQLRSLHQKHNECSMHQERNLLFAMAMFANKERLKRRKSAPLR